MHSAWHIEAGRYGASRIRGGMEHHAAWLIKGAWKTIGNRLPVKCAGWDHETFFENDCCVSILVQRHR